MYQSPDFTNSHTRELSLPKEHITCEQEDWSFAHLTPTHTLWGPHGYHRYPAKFIPQLVRRIIDEYSRPNECVGDPFLGSATTGVEALRMGRHFWGGDINDVALLISRAKCIPICPETLQSVWTHLESQLENVPHIGKRHLTSDETATISAIDISHSSRDERLIYWFPAPYRNSLDLLLQHILALHDEMYRVFFLCAFSNILKRCSIWLSGSTKVQKDLKKVLADPVDEFRGQSRDMLRRNVLYWNELLVSDVDPSTLIHKCIIQRHDARQCTLPDAALDLLVTSPPYATCYEYKEIHQLTQLWFERYGLVAVHNTEENWIGSKSLAHRLSNEAMSQCKAGSHIADNTLEKLSQRAEGSNAQSVNREVRALHYYFQDMSLSLSELTRTTKPGKYVVFIVGDSYRRGIAIPTSQIIQEMAQNVGLELERRIVRQIPNRVLVSTRNKTTGRFSSVAQSDVQVYPEEDILIFKRTSQ